MELFFKKFGEGKPLVILHGLFGMSDNWQVIANHLSKKYTVYLIDQRNHGRSFWSEEWNYAVMADDLNAFLIQHQIEKPILVGHSMGGKTLMNFLMRYSVEKYEKVIIVDISPRQYPIHHDHIIEALLAVKVSALHSRAEAEKQLAEKLPIPAVRQFLLKNLYRKEDNTFAWRMNLQVIAEQIENIGEGLEKDFVGHSVPAEMLFIKGEYSPYIEEADKTLIKTFFPKAEISTVLQAGHWVHAEQTQRFLEVLLNFLEK